MSYFEDLILLNFKNLDIVDTYFQEALFAMRYNLGGAPHFNRCRNFFPVLFNAPVSCARTYMCIRGRETKVVNWCDYRSEWDNW